jgi:creatinine amidohydrolase
MDWQAGHRLLAERVAQLPAAVRETLALAVPRLGFDLGILGRVVTTGVGSSEAHARFLAHLLSERVGLDARFAPLGAFAAPGHAPAGDLLVVFSQGLSPNARLAVASRDGFRHVAVVTAAGEQKDAVAALRRAGVSIVRFAGEDEFGTLVRVVGPLTGYLAAYRIAEALATAPGAAGALPALDTERIVAALEAALAPSPVPPAWLDAPTAFVASGGYGEIATNLRYKLLEGLYLPAPPVWDLVHMAHGPFQQAFAGPATFLVLARANAPGESALLARLEAMLDPERHRLVRLTATLPGPLAILEHEAQLNALVLRFIAERRLDQVAWPGRGREAPLYGIDRPPRRRRLADLTWPEVEAELARGCRTTVIALGATEQHGPHLPLATDAWIADALAERFCARVEDAIQGPTLALGCSAEHLEFPGTLDLRAETLTAVLADVIRSLGRHGFQRVFVFSAHGGNTGALRAALPALRAAAAPLEVLAFTDLDAVARTAAAASAAFGVGAEASGHHAGEFETSILLALRPGEVRAQAFAPGLAAPTADAQALFYPSLRPRAPSGTVGDPSGAAAARAEPYLTAWVELLVDAYRGEKKRHQAKGTQAT